MVIRLNTLYSNNVAHTLAQAGNPLFKKVLNVTRSSCVYQIFSLPALRKDIVPLSPEQLKTLLQSIAAEPDGKEILERLAHIISPEKLQQALQIDGGLDDLRKEAT